MNPNVLFSEQATQYKLSNLLFGVILIGIVFLGLYILWRWCSEETKTDNKTTSTERLTMKPVYAHEIEPGIVVLQSEDGEYFKILKEYDMSSRNRYGSVSCTRPEIGQPSQDLQTLENSDMTSSAFAQTHFQTQRPTAPPALVTPLMNNGGYGSNDYAKYGARNFPPPYDN